jgi:hypothetical protein
MGLDDDDGEVNAIVFLGCMLTIITCSATILYFRTSCVLDPVTLREMLKARRDIANRYGTDPRSYYGTPVIRNHRHRKMMDVIRVKRITTQYEMLTKDDK